MSSVSTTHPTPGPSVLVIDDEKTLAGMIGAYLSRAGYQARVVHTGPEGVQAVRDQTPDVVILDRACQDFCVSDVGHGGFTGGG